MTKLMLQRSFRMRRSHFRLSLQDYLLRGDSRGILGPTGSRYIRPKAETQMSLELWTLSCEDLVTCNWFVQSSSQLLCIHFAIFPLTTYSTFLLLDIINYSVAETWTFDFWEIQTLLLVRSENLALSFGKDCVSPFLEANCNPDHDGQHQGGNDNGDNKNGAVIDGRIRKPSFTALEAVAGSRWMRITHAESELPVEIVPRLNNILSSYMAHVHCRRSWNTVTIMAQVKPAIKNN